MADPKDRLAKMAAEAADPADREWAKAKLASLASEAAPEPAAEAAPTEQQPPGLLDRIGGQLKQEFHNVTDPQNVYGNLHSLANGFNNSFAFGLPGRILDWAGVTSPEGRAQEAQQFPRGSTAGNVAGLATSAVAGPEAAAGKTAQALASQAAQKAPFLASLPGRILGQTGAGALTGAETEAARAATNDQPILSAATHGAQGGAVMGGALGALGELAGAGANAVVGSKGGQARRLIEDYGGEVGPTTSGRGGAFDQELKGLPANDRGIGQVSRGRAARILNDTEEKFQRDVVQPSAAEKARIAGSPEGQQKVDTTPIYSDLVRLSRSQRLTPSEQGQVNQLLNRMEDPKTGLPREMTQAELNDYKGMLQDLSDTGSMAAPTVAKAKLQGVAHAVKEQVDRGPYADINARTAKGIAGYEGQRAQLGLKPQPSGGKPSPEGPSEEELAYLANALARQDQNTVTSGLRNSDRFDQFAQANPQYRRDIDMPDVLRAKADLGVHAIPGHGGLMGRLGHLSPGMGLSATAAMAAMGNHGPEALLPLVAGTAIGNWPAVSGRLLYTPGLEAEAASGLLRQLPGFLPMLEQAYAEAMARRQKERR